MRSHSAPYPRRHARIPLAAAATALLLAAVLACVLPGRALAQAPEDASFTGALTTTGPTPPRGVLAPVSGRGALAGAGDVLLSGVPSYRWRDGCTPTSAGMLIGFYDAHGFPDLIAGDASTETDAVKQAIASSGGPAAPRHHEDYALPEEDEAGPILPDRSEDPAGGAHPDDSLADFIKTSRSALGLAYGWSFNDLLGPGVRDYVALMDSSVTVGYADYSVYAAGSHKLTFAVLQAEIDAGRPMVLFVDSSGTGEPDHAVLAIGYRETSGYPEYACRDTWFSTVRWSRFQAESVNLEFEVFDGTAISLTRGGPPDDVTAPVTTVAGAEAAWSAAPVTLTFSSTDEGSGVDRIEAGVDGAQPAPLGGAAAALQVAGQGVHSVSYYAVDRHGNVEAPRTCTVRIDALRPVTRARAARVRKGARVTLRYRVDDLTPKASVRLVVRTRSGRSRATLRPGWRSTGRLLSASWRATLPRGSYRLWVYATDQAGNRQSVAGSARLTIR